MRIESVSAHAFGPLTERTLELAPGLTVICGDNESAKSSWHAAVYAALCGRKRGKGAPKVDERRWAEKHRPWDGDRWAVSAIVTLDDGRRVELYHDLDGKVDCRATDLTVNRDVSNEIMFEGAPDGSRWLGLDRRSFAATASISQAQMLSVLSHATGLQEHLQRAAATAGTDATAAAALERLDKFLREQVGTERATTKPLRVARDRVAAAEAALREARAAHQDYLALVDDAQQRRHRAESAHVAVAEQSKAIDALEQVLDAAREAEAVQQRIRSTSERMDQLETSSSQLRSRLETARRLAADLHGKEPTTLPAELDELAKSVHTAMTTWQNTPVPRTLPGPSAAQLRAEAAALPALPDGDTRVDAGVRDAASGLSQARAVARDHEHRRPADISEVAPHVQAAADAGPETVRALAAALGDTITTVDPALEAEHATAQRARDEALAALTAAEQADAAAQRNLRDTQATPVPAPAPVSAGARLPVLIGGAVAGVASVALFVAGQVLPGALVALVGAGLLIAGALQKSTVTPAATPASGADLPAAQHAARVTSDAVLRARQDLNNAERAYAGAEGRLHAAQHASRMAAAVRDDAVARATAWRLPTDPAALRELAAHAERLLAARTELATWTQLASGYADRVATAEDQLRAALSRRGVDVEGRSLDEALAGYEQDCLARDETARRCSARPALEAAIAERERAEEEVAAAQEVQRRAAATVLAAAEAADLPDLPQVPAAELSRPVIDALVASLENWLTDFEDRSRTAWEIRQGFVQLNTLLDGATLEDLEAEAAQAVADYEAAAGEYQEVREAYTSTTRRRDEVAAAAGLTREQSVGPQPVLAVLQAAQAHLEDLRRHANGASAAADSAEGAARERARALASVPEAEEALAAARVELARFEQLADTIARTTSYLQTAQESVHRDIAPVLTRTLHEWLPTITQGRYVDAMVDPATLEVSVCGPGRRWRAADLLSVGTTEQIYLLLRVALAQHLTTTGETCPLVLDDVTVQADPHRTEQILNLLLRLAETRQVVIFAQEPSVARWAEQHIATDPRHGIRTLEQIPVA